MAKFIGRKFSIGLAKESVRGTGVAAAFWIPKTDLTIDDMVNFAVDDSTIGVIEDGINQEVTGKASSGSISGRIYDTSFGLLLKATLGTEVATAVSGDTDAYDHEFTVLETAQHPTLTISAADPNSPSSGAGLYYTLATIDQLEIDFEVDKFLTYKADFKANANTAHSVTPSFVEENGFKPQDGTVKFADTLADLSGGTTVVVKKGTITIKKNIEEDFVIGSVTAVDRLNKEFSIEGSLELFYQDRVFIDTDMLADLAQAMEIVFVDTETTIAVSSHPTITIRLAKVKIQSVAKKITSGAIVEETVKFKAYYSMSDTEMVDITLRNLQTTTY